MVRANDRAPSLRAQKIGAGPRRWGNLEGWALMPPKPKPLTAARRGPSPGQSSGAVGTRKGLPGRGTEGPGRSKLAWHGQSNADVMRREMEIFDVLTANRDQRIWAVAKGGDLKVDDSNMPSSSQSMSLLMEEAVAAIEKYPESEGAA